MNICAQGQIWVYFVFLKLIDDIYGTCRELISSTKLISNISQWIWDFVFLANLSSLKKNIALKDKRK